MKSVKAVQKQQLEVVTRVSSAIRRLATAASSHLGSDCFIHAVIGQALLAKEGIASKVVVGFAAWRVGLGDGDVISHTNEEVSHLPPGVENGLPFHAWLELPDGGGRILDLTTYQIKQKAAELDAADGGKTTVTWAPDFLFAKKEVVSSYRDVAQSFKTGVFYYEPRPDLQAKLEEAGWHADEEDIRNAMILMDNPGLMVVGPNDMTAAWRAKP